MFEAAEIGSRVSREEYEAALPALRVDLLNAQFDLREAPFGALLLVAGDDRIACNEVVNRLHEWLDARFLPTEVFGDPSPEELERPRFWRYWRALPPRGRLGLFVGAWPLAAVAERVRGELGRGAFDRRIEHIERLESALVDDGMLLLKLWLHLPKREHARRLERARRKRRREWRVGPEDWRIYDVYDRALPAVERLLRRTSTARAPWQVVETTDPRHRDLTVGRALLAALRERLERPPAAEIPPPRAAVAVAGTETGILQTCDLSRRLSRDEYERELPRRQRRLRRAVERCRERGVSSVLVFEGWDAAGKGGVIRRITNALDAGDYRIVPIAAPSEEERAHHYLWRFWRCLPRAGTVLIFDRSWYGRVLVERVEGLAPTAAWRRAYAELRDFEEQLVEHGMPVVKLWLQIDRETQLERFRAREKTPYKKYKITAEDYRNRERWDDYVVAVNEMLARTSTEIAPWHVIPANDKRFARVEVLRLAGRALRRATAGKRSDRRRA